MKTSEFVAIEKQLLPHFPGLKIAGSMMVAEPMDWSLRAILFDRTSDKTYFTVWTMIMPLCIPSDHINMSWGSRIRIGGVRDGWRSDLPNLIPELVAALKGYAVPYLSEMTTIASFIDHVKAKNRPMRGRETLGYTLARAGRIEEAIHVLDALLAEEADRDWEHDVQKQARVLRDLLVNDPPGAQAQLDAWETETINNLKLQKISRSV